MANKYKKDRHNGAGTLTYARWKSMMARCYQINATNYKYYGARGITVCERWHDFSLFRADMGECRDKTLTLDRIKNDIGYEPGNCKWATQAVQNINRSYCVILTYNGITRNITEWAAHLGISANALSLRIRAGWSIERAITQPLKKRTLIR